MRKVAEDRLRDTDVVIYYFEVEFEAANRSQWFFADEENLDAFATDWAREIVDSNYSGDDDQDRADRARYLSMLDAGRVDDVLGELVDNLDLVCWKGDLCLQHYPPRNMTAMKEALNNG